MDREESRKNEKEKFASHNQLWGEKRSNVSSQMKNKVQEEKNEERLMPFSLQESH